MTDAFLELILAALLFLLAKQSDRWGRLGWGLSGTAFWIAGGIRLLGAG